MSRHDDWDDRRREDDYDDYRRTPRPNGAITGVAVINFIAGGIVLVVGICGTIGILAAAGHGGGGAFRIPGLGSALAIAVLVVLLHVVWGILAIVAGVGIIGRKNSGRIMSLVLGGIGILLGLLYMLGLVGSLGGHGAGGPEILIILFLALLFIGYTIWCYVVLLNGDNAREFR